MTNNRLKRFILPELNRHYFSRIVIVAVIAFILFKYICIPFRASGESMLPTYADGSVNFCFTLAYLFSSPEKSDVVTIRMAGNSVMLLKRIVAVENEIVEFRAGQLFVNGQKTFEPYASRPCDWSLSPRKVKPGQVYVIGDNRSVPVDRHHFGQTPIKRIVGVLLW